MNDDNLIALPTSETTESFSDVLSDLIRRGARQIITQAKALPQVFPTTQKQRYH